MLEKYMVSKEDSVGKENSWFGINKKERKMERAKKKKKWLDSDS